jgi:tetratricopeptide (TPR) repeat protein
MARLRRRRRRRRSIPGTPITAGRWRRWSASWRRAARKYLSQDPEPNSSSPAVAHWRLGLILDKEGKRPEAISELQTATKLDPKFEQAQKDLKRVKG